MRIAESLWLRLKVLYLHRGGREPEPWALLLILAESCLDSQLFCLDLFFFVGHVVRCELIDVVIQQSLKFVNIALLVGSNHSHLVLGSDFIYVHFLVYSIKALVIGHLLRVFALTLSLSQLFTHNNFAFILSLPRF